MVDVQDPFGQILRGGVPSLPFTEKNQYGQYTPLPAGTAYIGTVAEEVDLVEAREMNDDGSQGAVKLGRNNQPIMQAVITLENVHVITSGQPVPIKDPADPQDDGRRRIYGKPGIQKALSQEMRSKGLSSFGIGTTFTIKSTGVTPNPRGGTPGQTYEIQLTNVQPRGANPFAAVTAPPEQEQWAPSAPGGYVPPVQQAPAAPQQQFANPAVPAFPGQVVPAAAPQQPAFTPPPAPAGVNFDALFAQNAAPAAPAPVGIPVTPELIAQVQQAVTQSGLPLAQVITGMATFAQQQAGTPDPTLESRLTEALSSGQF